MTATASSLDEDSRERLGRLFDLHQHRIYTIALRISRDPESARDLLQETFLRARRDPSRLPSADDEVLRWLIRVLANLAGDRHRRIAVRETFRRIFVRHEPQRDHSEAIVAKRSLQTAMLRLPPRQRLILTLHELDGTPIAEIALLLGIREATARWHLAEAKKQLRRMLTSTKGEALHE